MIKINPACVLVEHDGEPIRTGEVKSAAKRMELARMKDEAAGAPLGRQAVLFEEYQEAMRSAQTVMTLGAAITGAIKRPLEGDDKLGATVLLERDVLCMEIYRAEIGGTLIELSAEQVVMIKDRAAKCWNTTIVAQVVRAVEGKDGALPAATEKPAAKAAASSRRRAGDVSDNKGIVTQNQKGDNVVHGQDAVEATAPAATASAE